MKGVYVTTGIHLIDRYEGGMKPHMGYVTAIYYNIMIDRYEGGIRHYRNTFDLQV